MNQLIDLLRLENAPNDTARAAGRMSSVANGWLTRLNWGLKMVSRMLRL